ncbi:MAG: hypothetical protein GY856_52535 [bacterium]|nr:hypothetical protein [bacterium]
MTRFGGLDIRLAALVLLGAATVSACSGNKDPEPMPSQTATQVTPQLEPPPELPPPIREPRPARGSTVKVIDPGGEEEEPLTLLEASRLAKARKTEAGEPIAEITDENLHEFAEGGSVIIIEGEPAAPAPELPPEPSTSDQAGDLRDDEAYWRNGALELRMGWRRAVDRINDLELESAALRQQFYAEEDLYLRDSQIKPAWDRVLDRLEQLRERAQRYEQELDAFLEQGRRAGVRQGWLNEGWELEPTREERERIERFSIHKPVDVPTINDAKDPGR